MSRKDGGCSDRKGETLEYDYDDGVAHWPEDGGDVRPLDSISEELTKDFGFSDTIAHLDFLYEAVEIIRRYSSVRIESCVVDAPADLTNFSDAKARVDRLAEKLNEFSELLFSAQCDVLTEMLLKHLDSDDAIQKYRYASVELMRVFAKMDQLEGRPGKPMTPQWIEPFCIHCQKFWYEQKGTGTRIMFNSERKTHITKWVQEVFVKLTEEMGVTTKVSALHGVARRIAAYRP